MSLGSKELIKIDAGGNCDAYSNPEKEYCKRTDVECSGHDIKNFPASETLCKFKCTWDDANCKSIKWNAGTCYLKDDSCTNSQLLPLTGSKDFVKIDSGASCVAYNKPNKVYCERSNVECTGHDIRNFPASEAECKSTCTWTTNCKSVKVHGGKCYMKDDICTNSELVPLTGGSDFVKIDASGNCAAFVSPSKEYCERDGVECEGHDIRNFPATPAICQSMCNWDVDCKSIKVHGGTCYLKSNVCTNSELVILTGSKDFVKTESGGSCALYTKPNKAYCERADVECSGHDIENIQTSEAICQIACTWNANCKSIKVHGSTCYLKDNLCSGNELLPFSGSKDFVKIDAGGSCNVHTKPSKAYCERTNMECTGHDIRNVQATEAECKDICSWDNNCKSAKVFGGKCYMKDDKCVNSALTYLSGSKDFVKIDAGGACAAYNQPSKGYCERSNVECSGHDINNLQASETLCKLLCTWNTNCKSIKVHGSTCYLKDHLCSGNELLPLSGSKDLVKIDAGGSCNAYNKPTKGYCERADVECTGYDIKDFPATEAECKDICSWDNNCKSTKVRAGQCYLKSQICLKKDLNYQSGSKDFVKTDAGDDCNSYTIPQKEFLLRFDLVCKGHMIKSFSATEFVCKFTCILDDDCKSCGYKDGTCELNNHVCENDELEPSMGNKDFIKVAPGTDISTTDYAKPTNNYCTRDKYDCRNHDNFPGFMSVTAEKCKELCDYFTTCLSAQFRNGQCWLKSIQCEYSHLTWDVTTTNYIKDVTNGDWASNVVTNPQVLSGFKIPGGMLPGRVVIVKGKLKPTSNILWLDLKNAGNKIAMHYSPRIVLNRIAFNSLQNRWGHHKEVAGVFKQGNDPFEMKVISVRDGYEIYADGQMVYMFYHRLCDLATVNALDFSGDAIVEEISVNGLQCDKVVRPWEPIHTYNPTVPVDPIDIPNGMLAGRLVTIKGKINSDAENFHIRFLNYDGTPLLVEARIWGDYLVLNSQLGSWGAEYRIHNSPFDKGLDFELVVESTHEAILVYGGGRLLRKFYHRHCDLGSIDTAYFVGDVTLTAIVIDWLPCRKVTRTWTPKTVYNPALPMDGLAIEEGMIPGRTITIKGKINWNAKRFTLNLKTITNHIAIHYDARIWGDYIAFNSLLRGWGAQKNVGQSPFDRGTSFEMKVVSTQAAYKLYANGNLMYTFEHRTCLLISVNRIQCKGHITVDEVIID